MSECRSFRPRTGGLAAALVLASILIAPGAAVSARGRAPRPAGPRQALTERPQHEVSVVLKLLQVYVTDRKGKPVEDLGLGDFKVTDNGQPVVLTEFERHALAEAPAEAPAEKAAETRAAPDATRKFFLFFDFAFNDPRGLVKARTAARHFLDTNAKPDDEIGVLSYSMLKGVRIHEFLTRDHAKVREMVERIGTKDLAGRASDLELQYWVMAQEPLAGSGGTGGDMAAANAGRPAFDPNKSIRDESKRIAQTFIFRLTALAKALRYVPGQKHVLFFSTGVPASIIYGSQAGNPSGGSGARTAFDAGDRVLRTQNEEMYREFGASGCTFYAFDTRPSAKDTNLFAYDSLTFERGSRGLGSTQGIYQDSTDIFQDEKTTGLNSLKRLTDITGGRYYANINLFAKNLEQVKVLTGTYYVVGYAAGEREDGRFHEVRVEVTRPGCEVRAQSGYFNPKPYAAMTKMEKELHLYDLALNERSLSRLPVSFPMAALAFPSADGLGLELVAALPGEVTGRFTGTKAELIALVFNARNDVRDVRRIEIESPPRRGRPLTFVTGVTLEPGDYTCRLVVRDMDTGLSAVSSVRASVRPAPAATGLRLGTPLLLRATAGGSFLEAGAPRGRPPLAWKAAYDFDRALLEPAAGTLDRQAQRVFILVPYAVPGTPEPEVMLTASLIGADGRPVPAPVSLAGKTRSGSAEILTLDMDLAGIAPGTYHLYINAQDRVSGTMAGTRTTMVVI